MTDKTLRYWVLAARPKTLTAALLPVVTATALALSDGRVRWSAAAWCAVFAALMQVAANLINDLYDYLKGTDREDRLGPLRACAQGWITPQAMKRGIAVTLILACMAGLCLLPYGGWSLIGVGLACVIFAFLYTTLLSYMGCGDLLVWLFFGFVPVCGTYYVQTGTLTPSAWALAAACGLVTDTLLVLNNYRDRTQDAQSGKRTLIVAWGERFGSAFYLWQGILGVACLLIPALTGKPLVLVCALFYLPLHVQTWREMVCIHEGRALNRILGKTSRNILAFAMLVTIGLCISMA